MVTFQLNIANTSPSLRHLTLIFDYKKANWEGLCDYLLDSELGLCLDLDDVEEVWAMFKHIVCSAMLQFIPRFRLRANQLPKWFDADLRHKHKCLKTLRRNCRRHLSASLLAKLKSSEESFNHLSKQSKARYERDLIFSFTTSGNTRTSVA